MPELLKAPVTPAQQARDALLGALVGLARATTSEPKTDDTDEVLNAGLRLAAQPDAPEEKLHRMLETVRTEKHRVAPGCASCAMPCGNTNDYDLARLWAAPETIRTLKLQMLSTAFALAQKRPQGQAQTAVYQLLFTLAGLGCGASSARSAARAKALPGVNRHPETAFLTRKVCTFRLPRKCCEKSAFFCALAAFARHCVRKKHSGQFVSRFPAFFRKFFAKKTLQTISKNILYK